MRSVELAKSSMTWFGKRRLGAEAFVNLCYHQYSSSKVWLMQYDATRRDGTKPTSLHAEPEMRMTAMAAFPEAVDRAYMVGSFWINESDWNRRCWSRTRERRMR